VARVIRARDWSSTTLGPLDQWPSCLRTALSLALHSSAPVAVHWGAELLTLYNDVCAKLLGDQHPLALGLPAEQAFPEVWASIGPMCHQTLRDGISTSRSNQPLSILRNGRQEHHRFDFTTTAVCADDGQIGGVMVFAVDVTQQHVLIAELQHRTRNLLAVVRAISTQSFQEHVGDAVLHSFVERLSSLGRVQGLLSRAEHERVKLDDVVWAELEAYANHYRSRLEVHGPIVRLFPHHVQTIALALHELVTNALKYGALRAPAGRLSITWETWLGSQGQQRLALTWRESGVEMPPDVSARRGQGRELIENSLRFSLHADTQLVFGSDGVWCRIELPVDGKKSFAQDASTSLPSP